jgi:hypothetical protein
LVQKFFDFENEFKFSSEIAQKFVSHLKDKSSKEIWGN